MADNIEPVTHLEKTIAGTVSPVTHLEKVIALYGGSGGSGGTNDYNSLTNKPSINGVTLTGNKTLAQLGIIPATNTKLGEVIVKKDGGISVDTAGYIWIDGFNKTTTTNPTTGEVTTVITNGGITTTEVSNPITGETTTTTTIGDFKVETKDDGKGNITETTLVGGAEVKQETDPSGNKSTSIGNKVVSGSKTETTTTTSTNPSTGNPVTTTIITTTTPNGTQQTTTLTETDPASGNITTTVETINGGSDGVDVGSASGDRTTTVTDSTGTTISTSTEDVSYTNGEEDQWLTQSEANTMIDNIGNSLGWEF